MPPIHKSRKVYKCERAKKKRSTLRVREVSSSLDQGLWCIVFCLRLPVQVISRNRVPALQLDLHYHQIRAVLARTF